MRRTNWGVGVVEGGVQDWSAKKKSECERDSLDKKGPASMHGAGSRWRARLGLLATKNCASGESVGAAQEHAMGGGVLGWSGTEKKSKSAR